MLLLEHILMDSRVVCVAGHFCPEKYFDERVGESNTHRVYKNIAWEGRHRLKARNLVGKHLHEHSEPWIVMVFHPFVALEFYENNLLVILHLDTKSVLD